MPVPVHLVDRPLVHDALVTLRDKQTTPEHFRHAATRISVLLAAEALRDVPTTDVIVETPLGPAPGRRIGADVVVVPVLRDADRKDVYELARHLGQLSEKARAGKLLPTDMQGGCFTISSLGGIGGTAFTPIINAPEVAILGVSRAAMRPVYRDLTFVPRLMLPLSLSYDHRVIDGAMAARFTFCSLSTSKMLLDLRIASTFGCA